ncbi:hypothetical protein AMTRI_Chr08g167960 [Amborella trichopoda]
MDILQEVSKIDANADARKDKLPEQSSSGSSDCIPLSKGYKLFDRQRSIRHVMGGGKAADVILWKQRRVTLAIIVGATIAWLLFEHSGVSFLSISSDVLLLLIVILFVRANCAVLWNKQLQPLPELVLSEEMVNNSAASFRVKLNYMLLMAHDIILGRDFKLFFKIVVCLWLVSIIGGFLSFFTLMYVGIIMSITLPALYNKYEERVDRCAGIVHSQLSKQYSRVDANVLSKLPHGFSKDKDR